MNGSTSTSGPHKSEGSGQKPSRPKNKTSQSAVMKLGDVTVAASSPDILKTIRPLPGQVIMSQDWIDPDDSMDEVD